MLAFSGPDSISSSADSPLDEALDHGLVRLGRREDVHVADRLSPPADRARHFAALDRVDRLEEGEHVVGERSRLAEQLALTDGACEFDVLEDVLLCFRPEPFDRLYLAGFGRGLEIV